MDVFHPASYTVDHLLSVDLEIAHTCYATQCNAMQSRDCANSQIARNIYITAGCICLLLLLFIIIIIIIIIALQFRWGRGMDYIELKVRE